VRKQIAVDTSGAPQTSSVKLLQINGRTVRIPTPRAHYWAAVLAIYGCGTKTAEKHKTQET